MSEFKKPLARRIKELREEAGLTQAELAKVTRKSLETISNFERGKTTPSIQSLATLAETLEVNIADFFTHKGNKKTRSSLVTTIRNKSEALTERDQRVIVGVIDLLQKRSGKP